MNSSSQQHPECSFCREPRTLIENDLAFVRYGSYPVSPGHCLIMPRYWGDMANPKGGVRGVNPEKQKYRKDS